MKNQSIQKNIGAMVATLVLVFSLVVGTASFAAPGDTSTPPLNPGNAAQGVDELVVGTSLSGVVGLNASSPLNNESVFPEVGNTMAIFGDLLVIGNTYIGEYIGDNSLFTYFSALTFSEEVHPTNTLNIAGNLLATNISHSTSGTSEPLCVDPGGNIKLCSSIVIGPTYGWSVGVWGSCVSGTKTRTVTCEESTAGNTVADSFCTDPKPTTTSACSTGSVSCNVPSDCSVTGETCVGASVRLAGGCTGSYTIASVNNGPFFGELLGTYAYAAPGDADTGLAGPPPIGRGPGTYSCTGFSSSNSCLSHSGCSWSPETYSVTTAGTCQGRNSCLYQSGYNNPDFGGFTVDSAGELDHYEILCANSLTQLDPTETCAGTNCRYKCDDGTFDLIGWAGNSSCSLDAPATSYYGSDGPQYEDWYLDWIKA